MWLWANAERLTLGHHLVLNQYDGILNIKKRKNVLSDLPVLMELLMNVKVTEDVAAGIVWHSWTCIAGNCAAVEVLRRLVQKSTAHWSLTANDFDNICDLLTAPAVKQFIT